MGGSGVPRRKLLRVRVEMSGDGGASRWASFRSRRYPVPVIRSTAPRGKRGGKRSTSLRLSSDRSSPLGCERELPAQVRDVGGPVGAERCDEVALAVDEACEEVFSPTVDLDDRGGVGAPDEL